MSRLRVKNPATEKKVFKQRALTATILITTLFLLNIIKLVELQVVKHHQYRTLSNKNQLSVIAIPPTRGLIYDRNGVLLAENLPIFTLEITPERVIALSDTLKRLKVLLPSISDDEIKAFYRSLKQHRRFEAVPLKFKLTELEVATFSVNQFQFPGVQISAGVMRSYPLGKLTAHLLGFVGRINTKELASLDASAYAATNFIGKVGIEKYYEQQLHGIVGNEQVEIDVSGRIVRRLKHQSAKSGTSIYLTIDSKLQRAAFNALEGHQGSVVAINPQNGEILALVSTPSYDPNNFVKGISQKDYDLLAQSKKQPLYNRALRGQYPLGSTIKPFLAIGALNNNIVKEDNYILDKGWFKLNGVNHLYRDWKKTGHGRVNLERAIVVSCDTYFYELANLMGIRKIDEILNDFGFGFFTGIDMGEELPGLIPTPEWKRAIKHTPWYTGDTIISGIGQGFMLTTPLQLANATAKLSLRGKHYKPHLLKSFRDGELMSIYQPIETYPLLSKEQSWQSVIHAMEEVIKAKHGTGFRFGRKPAYRIAAKTGTAQVYSIKQNKSYNENDIPEYLRDHSLFIAFAPIKNPKIAIAVVVENSPIAPNVARKVIDNYLLGSAS